MDWVNTETAISQEKYYDESIKATKAQTIATLTLIDSIDKLDGNIGNVKIKIDGYDYSDETGWYAINENKDNE
jgi:hypothetical protein